MIYVIFILFAAAMAKIDLFDMGFILSILIIVLTFLFIIKWIMVFW